MRLHHDPATDSLYIELKDQPGVEAREIAPGLIVDLDVDGNVVGFDIESASHKADITRIETIALPVPRPAGYN